MTATRTTASTTPAAVPPRTGGFAGRSLVSLLGVGAAGLLFGILLILVRVRWAPLESVDGGIAARLNRAVAHNATALVVLRFVTTLGSSWVLVALVAIGVVLLAVRRRARLAIYLVVITIGELVLDPTLKLAVGRLRPMVANPVALAPGNSFPSGHALGSIVCYGALLLVFTPVLSQRARRAVIVGGSVLVAAIGISRLALGVHYLSDVLGGWALGVAWLGLTAYAFELWRRDTGRPATRPLTEGLEPEAARDLAPTTAPSGAPPAVRAHRPVHAMRTAAIVTVSWVIVFGAVTGLGELVVRSPDANLLGDRTIPHWLAAHRTPLLNTITAVGSYVGNTGAIALVGLIAATAAVAALRHWRPAVFLLVTMVGEVGIFVASAAILRRPRPDVPHLDGAPPTSSFPSGHLAATICLYAAIALLVMGHARGWWRWLALTAAVVMPVWVGLSRLYRGMHHPTDVAASLVLAGLWLTATVYAIRPNQSEDG